MGDKVLRKIFLAFIEVHILHHAQQKSVYGAWMMEELKKHGYNISAGTMYPIFHSMEKSGLLICKTVNVSGKLRKYYSITEKGRNVLSEAKNKIKELSGEI